MLSFFLLLSQKMNQIECATVCGKKDLRIAIDQTYCISCDRFGKWRDRQGDTESETYKQTDRQAEGQMERHSGRQPKGETDIYSEMEVQKGRQTDKQAVEQTDRRAGRRRIN